MFSWITGPRITNAIEDLQPENNYESTLLDAPETPAHQFAVKAFKQAIFGTPAPEDANNTSKKLDRKARLDAANAKVIELPAPTEDAPPLSPSKQPGGILMTPGTASKGRKTVSFGSQVVDNEGKRGNAGKSGIPNDCPGKFPSPWTPGTQLKLEPGSDKRPRTKLTEALLDARTTTQPKSGQKPKAKDDSDITIDLGAPRSESGKYWKEQYESYAERSEKEMKKVIAKQQLAKKFAMKKDGEVTELATKLEQERKKFRQRERELEQQNTDIQERLQRAMADNTSAIIEIAALKARIAVLERSRGPTSSEALESRPSFDIYEDASKDGQVGSTKLAAAIPDVYGASFSMASSGKENHSPSHRRQRRQTLTDVSTRPNPSLRLGTAEGEASIILGKSPRRPIQTTEKPLEAQLASSLPERLSRSPTRKTEQENENLQPQSPAAVAPSSPLPMPSPGIDPWIQLNDESSIPQYDKMAMPQYSGDPFSRPEWNPPPRQGRAPKSASAAKHTTALKSDRTMAKHAAPAQQPEATHHSMVTDRPSRHAVTRPHVTTGTEQQHKAKTSSTKPDVIPEAKTSLPSPTDPKFDLSKLTAHHAEGSTQIKKDRAEILPVDRKEEARKRLEARKKLRKNAPA
ncbi:spindle pole body formation-associated protein-domain-containing protein [Paraphoma chrysanthemicola]|uniref:Spindle pole body formation-associated protein-domain-containing protein n=1 Tax=Paraphoma chrysanthemicola TaxID=798071 RepID=A0A8K0VYG7_9PLEO|nr:spindle pole body formation-associated protein-domain-containing protein [Paraphoma chrysanthemicola]